MQKTDSITYQSSENKIIPGNFLKSVLNPQGWNTYVIPEGCDLLQVLKALGLS
jgi:hypothetical protein